MTISYSTVIGYATYTGPPSMGFYPNRRYRISIRGDKLRAQEIGSLVELKNEYRVGGFLANWKDIEIAEVIG